MIQKMSEHSFLPQHQVHGQVLKEKWEHVVKWQYQNKNVLSTDEEKKISKVPAVETFRKYIHKNTVARMYFQAGLNAIP
jgi:hypothetical protein